MAWWTICFLAILATIVSKSYFTTAVNRLRQSLARRQREALVLKGSLRDTRQAHQLLLRSCREKEVAVKQLQTQIATFLSSIETAKAQRDEDPLTKQPRES